VLPDHGAHRRRPARSSQGLPNWPGENARRPVLPSPAVSQETPAEIQLPEPVVLAEAVARDFPITEQQREIFLGTQLGDEANCAFNESTSLLLKGVLNTPLSSAAWNSWSPATKPCAPPSTPMATSFTSLLRQNRPRNRRSKRIRSCRKEARHQRNTAFGSFDAIRPNIRSALPHAPDSPGRAGSRPWSSPRITCHLRWLVHQCPLQRIERALQRRVKGQFSIAADSAAFSEYANRQHGQLNSSERATTKRFGSISSRHCLQLCNCPPTVPP
jgi:hypothetical protein